MCNGELESLKKLDATKSATVETLRLEKDTLTTQLDAKKEENEKLKADLEAVSQNVFYLFIAFIFTFIFR